MTRFYLQNDNYTLSDGSWLDGDGNPGTPGSSDQADINGHTFRIDYSWIYNGTADIVGSGYVAFWTDGNGWSSSVASSKLFPPNYPATSDVRSGTTFGGGTGTCAVPTADQTLKGASVDATTGNLYLPSTDGSGTGTHAALVLSTAHFGVGNATVGTATGGTSGIDPANIIAPQYVLTGHNNYTGGSAGSLTLPIAGKVDATNGAFGVGGTGTTPTLDLTLLVAKTAVASADHVASGVPRWTGATGGDVGTFTHTADYVLKIDVVGPSHVAVGVPRWTGATGAGYVGTLEVTGTATVSYLQAVGETLDQFPRGDDMTVEAGQPLDFLLDATVPEDLTGASYTYSLRMDQADDSEPAALAVSGRLVTDETDADGNPVRKLRFEPTHDLTEDLAPSQNSGDYLRDIQIVFGGGYRRTIHLGRATILRDVTRGDGV